MYSFELIFNKWLSIFSFSPVRLKYEWLVRLIIVFLSVFAEYSISNSLSFVNVYITETLRLQG